MYTCRLPDSSWRDNRINFIVNSKIYCCKRKTFHLSCLSASKLEIVLSTILLCPSTKCYFCSSNLTQFPRPHSIFSRPPSPAPPGQGRPQRPRNCSPEEESLGEKRLGEKQIQIRDQTKAWEMTRNNFAHFPTLRPAPQPRRTVCPLGFFS